ncbi:DUF58 domain-containing protein [Halofilum ochraceum]|uniref:DUF58 domain-containing protein n=1 Tax=Halofilum ochraceum TaxID=1611323 RepID=UPI000836734A|nr:DUF58 domain-containing protein [Halofilum ochraceum]
MRLGLPGIGAVPGMTPLRRLRSAIAERWLDRRVPRESARIRLHRRRLFILPTPLGYTFAATLALLLLGALNYGASLGFAVTFLLAGSGALAMIHTYRNLEGLELTFSPPPAAFAGERPRLPVRLRADAPQRWGIALEGGDGRAPVTAPAPEAPADAEFRFPPRPRGRFRPPRLRVCTEWPFGLLRVWSWVWPDVGGIVYPACLDHGLPPPERPASTGIDRPSAGAEEDFAGLRAYQPGDSPRRISWTAFARTDDLLVKAFESAPAGDYRFDWDDTAPLQPEERLEQLCFWVVRAERAGLRYGLALPDQRIDPGTGPAHRARCLEALALLGIGEDATA